MSKESLQEVQIDQKGTFPYAIAKGPNDSFFILGTELWLTPQEVFNSSFKKRALEYELNPVDFQYAGGGTLFISQDSKKIIMMHSRGFIQGVSFNLVQTMIQKYATEHMPGYEVVRGN